MKVVVTKLWLVLTYHGLDDGKHVHLLESRKYNMSIALTTDTQFHSPEGTWVRASGTVECDTTTISKGYPASIAPYLFCNASDLDKDTSDGYYKEERKWLDSKNR